MGVTFKKIITIKIYKTKFSEGIGSFQNDFDTTSFTRTVNSTN
jgi:hypothetical protein